MNYARNFMPEIMLRPGIGISNSLTTGNFPGHMTSNNAVLPHSYLNCMSTTSSVGGMFLVLSETTQNIEKPTAYVVLGNVHNIDHTQ